MAYLADRMSESWASRKLRWGFNLIPAFRGTGARVKYISADFREARVELPLNWRTRNYVGTIFGGSLYGAVDPMYMIQLIKILGPAYTVWDKAATIRFRRPGRTRLFAAFRLTEGVLEEIRHELTRTPKVDRAFQVELVDAAGTVHATIDKVIHVSLRAAGTDIAPAGSR